ncbi:MAG TPA: glutamate--tRNA ligase family protein [Kofleriaceae bacterium]|nr:glutamate--tRNA ligase family protein [Kofleriaceae bacterium]
MAGCSRFAPSVTGEAHPGTLLSGLLAWLDARSRGDRFLMRLEDLDHTRERPGFADGLLSDFAWLGIDWDELHVQSRRRALHEGALDRLESAGLLYPCRCSRSARAASGRRAPDGGWAYDNRCRTRRLPPGGWRAARDPVRMALPERRVQLVDEGGLDLSQCPAIDMGDPVLVRRDGVLAYHLAVVVDDGDAAVTRVIRGRDIAPSTATHILLQDLLGLARPGYRHHFLLLDGGGEKLAKLHGSAPARQLRARYSAEALVGLLACAAGLVASPRPRSASSLVAGFGWDRVRRADLAVAWTAGELRLDRE